MYKRTFALLSLFAIFGSGCISQPTPTPKPTSDQNTEIPVVQPATPTEQASSQTWDVSISNFVFAPATLTVKKGDRISFTNKDSMQHSATADNSAFDTGLISKNISKVIDTSNLAPGAYGFHCTLHPNMKGTIIVE